MQELFADKVLTALHAAGLLASADIENMKSWKHSGFNVFIGEAISPSDKQRLLFAARYLRKCPLSNNRLSVVERGAETVIEYAAYKDGVKSIRRFSPLQCLAEVQQHIPDMWEQTTRFLGAYSARTRGAAKANYASDATLQPDIVMLPEPTLRPSASWARCMKRIFELDPLLCPKCRSPMKIKSFITDPKEAHRISQNVCRAVQRAPPRLRYSLPLAA